MPHQAPTPRPGVPLWETLAILLAIASLWPAYVLPILTQTPPHAAWRWICYVMLGVMVLVLIRRILAFRRLSRERDAARRKRTEPGQDEGPNRVRLPWEPDP